MDHSYTIIVQCLSLEQLPIANNFYFGNVQLAFYKVNPFIDTNTECWDTCTYSTITPYVVQQATYYKQKWSLFSYLGIIIIK